MPLRLDRSGQYGHWNIGSFPHSKRTWYSSVLFHRYTLPQVLHEKMPGPSEGEKWCMPLPLERRSGDVWFGDDLVIIMPCFRGCNKRSRWVFMLDVSVTFLWKSSGIFTGVFTPAFNKEPDKVGWLHWWLLRLRPEWNTFLEVDSDICKFVEIWCAGSVLSCDALSAVKLLRTNEEKSPGDWMPPQAPVTLRALG